MAEQMQNIQRRIKSIGSTERITNAMKLVSEQNCVKQSLLLRVPDSIWADCLNPFRRLWMT